jgi:hypothetical protein
MTADKLAALLAKQMPGRGKTAAQRLSVDSSRGLDETLAQVCDFRPDLRIGQPTRCRLCGK